MKKGDFGTKLKFTVTDEEGIPVDLSEATVLLVLRLGKEIKTFECTTEDEEEGVVSYVVQEEDLNFAGKAEIELDITYTDQHYTSTRIKEKIDKTIL